MEYSKIKGFNYQPSWGSSGFEIWRNFDSERMGHELSLGKLYFSGMNAIRLWLSHDAWVRDPKKFGAAFESALSIASAHSLSVMPVLFNRWHDPTLDYGGIYIDHFLPKVSWVQRKDQPAAFTEALVGAHASDPRIMAWDLCNEPFSYSRPLDDIPEIEQAEYDWLESLYRQCKDLGAIAPITVGTHMGTAMERVDPICDVLSIHPYWKHGDDEAAFGTMLDECRSFADRVNKPILATETCWGHLDDSKRVEVIRFTLGELKKRGIGWLVYLLHHSLIADAHRPEYGPVGDPMNLAFVEADGTLRPGHDVFNEF